MRSEEVTVTDAQAGIRRLYEQVRVVEAEAARTLGEQRRRQQLPRALVLLAAAAIGVASAGLSHPSARREPVRAVAAVVHLIDAPAERARALSYAAKRRVHTVRRAPALVATPVVQAAPRHTEPLHTAPLHTAPPHTVALHVVARAVPSAPQRTVAPAATARPRPQPSAAPVGIGPVVVTTTDEPQPDPAGATPTGQP